MPWLEPDVVAHIEALHGPGVAAAVVVSPIGFVSDHLEVIWDLDTEAAQRAAELGTTSPNATGSAGTPLPPSGAARPPRAHR